MSRSLHTETCAEVDLRQYPFIDSRRRRPVTLSIVSERRAASPRIPLERKGWRQIHPIHSPPWVRPLSREIEWVVDSLSAANGFKAHGPFLSSHSAYVNQQAYRKRTALVRLFISHSSLSCLEVYDKMDALCTGPPTYRTTTGEGTEKSHVHSRDHEKIPERKRSNTHKDLDDEGIGGRDRRDDDDEGQGPSSKMTTRKKTEIACHRCRERKIRCDGQRPSCAACAKAGVEICEYDAMPKRRGPGRKNKDHGTRSPVEQNKSSEASTSMSMHDTGLPGPATPTYGFWVGRIEPLSAGPGGGGDALKHTGASQEMADPRQPSKPPTAHDLPPQYSHWTHSSGRGSSETSTFYLGSAQSRSYAEEEQSEGTSHPGSQRRASSPYEEGGPPKFKRRLDHVPDKDDR